MDCSIVEWDLCRACMSCDENMQSLFDVETGEDLAAMFSNCVGYQISRYDNLPGKICQDCLRDLREYHAFSEMIQNAHRGVNQHIAENLTLDSNT